MKYSLIKALALAALVLAGCSDDDDDKNPFFGYLSPGTFRLKGILDDKQYALFAPTDVAPPAESCGPSPDCLAVYTNWPASVGNNVYLPYEGIAISDRNRANPHLEMKIHRLQGQDWAVSLIYRGVAYSATVNSGLITIALSQSTIETIPSYITPENETLEGSGKFITRATVTFGQDITLSNHNDKAPLTMTIRAATDSIVAIGHSVF